MELGTIIKIREKRDELRETIKNLSKETLHQENRYGSENEYSYIRMITELKFLMSKISIITKAPKKFLSVFTYNERVIIAQHIDKIITYIESPNNFLPQFEALKTIVRHIEINNQNEFQYEFENEIKKILEIKVQLQQELKEVVDIKESIKLNDDKISVIHKESIDRIDKITNEINEAILKKEKAIELTDELESINEKIRQFKNKAEDDLAVIEGSLSEIKSNEKLIDSFANKVQEREQKLDEIQSKTEANSKKLDEYEVERKSILKNSKELIESAKQALNYKTAEGISASFQEQYNSANNRWIFGSWIFGAVLCLIATVGLGIWILQTSSTNTYLLIGRISLLPLPIIGTIFCANQYTKQKNIIEDYAYKMVLAKAIVGFSEQLKKHGSENNEEYITYITTTLKEINKDPLRKRDKKKSNSKSQDSSLNDLIEVAENIVKIGRLK